MSTRAYITANNTTGYALTLFKKWGGPFSVEPPAEIQPNQTDVKFALDDNDRAGVVYLAKDSQNREVGFVSMSFTCPKSSSNSAEGSPNSEGVLIQSGLQRYNEHGTPVSFTYNIGTPNMACWSDGTTDDANPVCPQTTLEEWARVLVSVDNTKAVPLHLESTWQNGPWTKEPTSIPAGGKGIFLLNDNDRAGLQFLLNNNIPINMAFTCPKSSSNSAEGSPLAGLQQYAEHGTPVNLSYVISEVNQACWDSGSSNNGKVECSQTLLSGLDSWMQNSLNDIGTHKLKNICIPGSHDSGMSISQHGTAGAGDCNTITQQKNILGQLEAGARYFDIRPIIGGGTYFTGHYSNVDKMGLGTQGARGESIADIITQLNTFTEKHQELIILNLSHSLDTDSRDSNHNYSPFNDQQWDGLFETLLTINHLYIVEGFPPLGETELNNFISQHSSVVIIAEPVSESVLSKYKGKGFFPSTSLSPYNSYSNSNSLGDMESDQLDKMKKQRAQDNYFLLSWTLTQSDTQAGGCIFDPTGATNSILDLAKIANNGLSSGLLPALSSQNYPNIIYTDDVGSGFPTSISMYINKFYANAQSTANKTYTLTLLPGAITNRDGIYKGSSTEAVWSPCNPIDLGGWNDGDELVVTCTLNLNPDIPNPPSSNWYVGLCAGACPASEKNQIDALISEAQKIITPNIGELLGTHISTDKLATENTIFYDAIAKVGTFELSPASRGVLKNYIYGWTLKYNGKNTVVENGSDVEIVFGYGDPQQCEVDS